MPKRKFLPVEVLEIRASPKSAGQEADLRGVSTSTICKIRNYWIYKKVKYDLSANTSPPPVQT